ncbi:hypothetical protein PCC8801_3503 [Rippkaea orientalis PCC 8801]|uniref:Uncharacterized protein n=1 Tax=Rippkaea orientalis (strain PCC 8801 / RF-1) TaxID=41431 RepID=B7K0I4_RIPO1|nr:hypothetical protein PCC8801_3503 [Rippkaea orientalis PCC 8801]
MWQTQTREPFFLEGNDARNYLDLSRSLVERLCEFCDDIDESDQYSERTGCLIF